MDLAQVPKSTRRRGHICSTCNTTSSCETNEESCCLDHNNHEGQKKMIFVNKEMFETFSFWTSCRFYCKVINIMNWCSRSLQHHRMQKLYKFSKLKRNPLISSRNLPMSTTACPACSTQASDVLRLLLLMNGGFWIGFLNPRFRQAKSSLQSPF